MKPLLLLCLFLTLSVAARAELKNDAQVGLILTNGNTKTKSLNLRDRSRYGWGRNALQFDAHFLRAQQNGIESAKNWAAAIRFERELDPKLSVFVAQAIEGDPFANIQQRYNSDLGAKYYFIRKEKDLVWFSEGGYRFTRENSTRGARNSFQKARLFTEAEKYWASGTSTKLWVEYIPNFTVSEGWLLNAEASVSAALNEIFAIKTAYQFRFNNLPPGAAGKTDTAFTTSLAAKF